MALSLDSRLRTERICLVPPASHQVGQSLAPEKVCWVESNVPKFLAVEKVAGNSDLCSAGTHWPEGPPAWLGGWVAGASTCQHWAGRCPLFRPWLSLPSSREKKAEFAWPAWHDAVGCALDTGSTHGTSASTAVAAQHRWGCSACAEPGPPRPALPRLASPRSCSCCKDEPALHQEEMLF